MKHKTYFLYLAAAVLMTGCKVQKKNQNQPAAKPAQLKQSKEVIQSNTLPELRLDQIFIEKIGQHRPSVYDLLVSWPKTKNLVRISMLNKVLFTSETSDENYSIANLQGGTKVFVLVEILNDKNQVLDSKLYEEEIPEDLTITTQTLIRNTEYHHDRIFMDRSVITTENFNLVIRAKELIILNDSRIQNFEPGTKARPGVNGRSGGFIDIEVKTAEGMLLFYLNSESGGDGLQGYYITKMGAGKEKQDIVVAQCRDGGHGFNAGQNGDLRLKVENYTNFYHHEEDKEFASGGQPGPKLGHAPPSYPAMSVGSSCPAQPLPGAAASKGKTCVFRSGLAPEKDCE